jgi:Flp pilus assembly protein TadG
MHNSEHAKAVGVWWGFLRRLARDRAGTTAALMAAALVPLAAFTGAALDTARLYVVKVRLQQSCDAGALAGRKMMTGLSLDSASKEYAQTFFKNNFRSGWFQTADVSFVPEDTADGQVKGTATAKVPVTIMKMFGAQPTTLTVTCEARKEIGDVDVMFVLDVTGSMTCNTSEASCTQTPIAYSTSSGTRYYLQEKADSKIIALRSAVMTFYDTLDAAKDPSSRIRYGFVPYASSANVGSLLPTGYLANTSTTPSRRIVGDANSGSPVTTTQARTNEPNCNGLVGRSPATGYPAQMTTVSWVSGTGSAAPGTCTITRQNLVPLWRYEQISVDVSQYKTGVATLDPTRIDGSTNVWDGCVVERETRGDATFPQAGLPADLDIDLVPSSEATRWRPAWINTVYDRPNVAPDDTSSENWPGTTTDVKRSRSVDALFRAGFYTCPKRAQRLAEMNRQAVYDYVYAADFKGIGGTYHDVGMVWGARLISPTGIFASDTDCRANRTCGRHIVFMTDGAMAPNHCIYGTQGLERLDGRVMGATPNGNCTNASNQNWATSLPATLDDRHNARFLALCTQAKNKGITIWVVAYAQSLTDDMKSCASNTTTAIYAPTDQKLQDAFRQIAGKIAELRISK